MDDYGLKYCEVKIKEAEKRIAELEKCIRGMCDKSISLVNTIHIAEEVLSGNKEFDTKLIFMEMEINGILNAEHKRKLDEIKKKENRNRLLESLLRKVYEWDQNHDERIPLDLYEEIGECLERVE